MDKLNAISGVCAGTSRCCINHCCRYPDPKDNHILGKVYKVIEFLPWQLARLSKSDQLTGWYHQNGNPFCSSITLRKA